MPGGGLATATRRVWRPRSDTLAASPPLSRRNVLCAVVDRTAVSSYRTPRRRGRVCRVRVRRSSTDQPFVSQPFPVDVVVRFRRRWPAIYVFFVISAECDPCSRQSADSSVLGFRSYVRVNFFRDSLLPNAVINARTSVIRQLPPGIGVETVRDARSVQKTLEAQKQVTVAYWVNGKIFSNWRCFWIKKKYILVIIVENRRNDLNRVFLVPLVPLADLCIPTRPRS